ncbi:MAG: histidinol-phosphatase [Bacteroidetes bacterium]|nr:MAG: histidinol-phosphatase [Bacteroidota bacterium]
MKKIDLHIHTIPTESDSHFDFSQDKLKEYVDSLHIDCIAITNHNLFDLEQYNSINNDLDIKVFPGIEINFEKGHLLLISDDSELEDFEIKCNQIKTQITTSTDYITISNLKEIFLDLNKYLLIPHYEKKQSVKTEILNELKEYITSGEVSSPKKFKYCINDDAKIVPVIFSDLRFYDDMVEFSPKQTYIDLEEITLTNIKNCLLDKNKVHLSEDEGHEFFQVFENEQILSTGLNVILGERSSGKSYTLRRIKKLFDNVKFIKQFELLETDEKKDVEKFNKWLSVKRSSVSELYLKEFRDVVNDVVEIDINSNERKIENYINSLLKVASEEEMKDVYSNALLYNENHYSISDSSTLKKLIDSVILLIENEEYRSIINMHIPRENLIKLLQSLINKLREINETNLKKSWVNSIVSNIKIQLQSFTASISINEIDLYNIQMEKEKINKFCTITNYVKKEKIIDKKEIRRFKIIASTRKFTCAQELLNKFRGKTRFSDAFPKYDNPILYLDELKKIPLLEQTNYYLYFVDVDFRILNEHNIEVSGGERSEFNLLEKIQDAHHFDMLLIDEPESSFDNLFLKNEVNEQIRDISKTIPVVIVTHNNTVGASIKPDYILYTKKDIVDKKPIFKIFGGYPSATKLTSVEGEEIDNYNIMLNCLEAGKQAYDERGKCYETLKN